ncbi:hypothetical protein BCR37DRAFT_378781 [Protomyces lactucae-debilis]|uniref:Uncharacterized protein n=1 Tax=Protomyces lactucae-debilis TaxID=2754530 RepID=A0A1Y2FJM9_PROLT|nr:uncharacterized protein BCR37DRAFT_378781 [Protomyces lactucae-debilis]ORY83797.1 hypothetical protein BCR37DRAFT_378781 [Protomyces lactucae-debilis]
MKDSSRARKAYYVLPTTVVQGVLRTCYAFVLVPPRRQWRRGNSCHALQPEAAELSPSLARCVCPVVVSMN